MLIKGLNDQAATLEAIAAFLAHISPRIAYLAIPTRPPDEKFAVAPSEQILNTAFQIFKKHTKRMEYLIGYEGNAFAFSGDVEDDILSIAAVHPMREDAVHDFLGRAGSDWSVIERLIQQNRLSVTTFEGKKFYLRTLKYRP